MKTTFTTTLLVPTLLITTLLSACNLDIYPLNSTNMKSSIEEFSKSRTGVISIKDNALIINGVSYDLNNAKVFMDGLQSEKSQLRPGMVATVSQIENSDGSGSTLTIYYEDEVEGTVSSNSVSIDGTGQLVVLGQKVHIDNNTVFESFDVSDVGVSDIDSGNVVEVSGFSSGDGEVWATRVEVKNSQYNIGEEIELKGYISALNETTFNIGELTIDFENAALDNDFSGTLANDLYVKVSSYQGYDENGLLLADEVELKSNSNGTKHIPHSEDDKEVELEGIITAELSDNEIEINGSKVTITKALQEKLSNPNAFIVGTRVEIEGYINSNGKFIAEKLEIESDSESSNEEKEDGNDKDDTDDHDEHEDDQGDDENESESESENHDDD